MCGARDWIQGLVHAGEHFVIGHWPSLLASKRKCPCLFWLLAAVHILGSGHITSGGGRGGRGARGVPLLTRWQFSTEPWLPCYKEDTSDSMEATGERGMAPILRSLVTPTQSLLVCKVTIFRSKGYKCGHLWGLCFGALVVYHIPNKFWIEERIVVEVHRRVQETNHWQKHFLAYGSDGVGQCF